MLAYRHPSGRAWRRSGGVVRGLASSSTWPGRTLLRVTGRVSATRWPKASPSTCAREFRSRHTAVTAVAISATSGRQTPPDPDLPCRAVAQSFWHWLEASAAEFGLEFASAEVDPFARRGARAVALAVDARLMRDKRHAPTKRAEAEPSWVETARRVLPGGFGNVSRGRRTEGRAGHVWDVSGNEYRLSPGVRADDRRPCASGGGRSCSRWRPGTTFFANNEYGIRLAAEIVDAVPCRAGGLSPPARRPASTPCGSPPSETRQDPEIRGGYHGMSDYGLMSWRPSGPAISRSRSDSAGIPRACATRCWLPFNDGDGGEPGARAQDELAGIIVEPFSMIAQARLPRRPAQDPRDNGLLLIFDSRHRLASPMAAPRPTAASRPTSARSARPSAAASAGGHRRARRRLAADGRRRRIPS